MSNAILFISGAGLPAWIWDDVRQSLGPSYGTRVAARPAIRAGTSLGDYAEAAVGSAPAGRFAIVAHSAGGVIGAEVSRLVPERVSALLAVSAVVPAAGGSFLTAMPAPNRWILGAAMRVAGTRPPDAAIRRGLAGRLDGPIADRLIGDFVAEAATLYRGRTGHGSWSGRRGYVFTGRDRELPLAIQRRSARVFAPDAEEHLDTGHLPMIENPRALAAAIAGFLGDTQESGAAQENGKTQETGDTQENGDAQETGRAQENGDAARRLAGARDDGS
jgi:pimeloyl-ACP methyl ester carboxylesterase